MSSKETSSPVLGSTRFCWMRVPVLPLSWWKRTVFRETAEYSLTGTFTSPKEIAPLQIDRGIDALSYPGVRAITARTRDCGPTGSLRSLRGEAGGLGEGVELLLGELEIDRRERVGDRLRAARARDRDHHRAEREQPGQRDLLRRDAVRLRGVLDRVVVARGV